MSIKLLFSGHLVGKYLINDDKTFYQRILNISFKFKNNLKDFTNFMDKIVEKIKSISDDLLFFKLFLNFQFFPLIDFFFKTLPNPSNDFL